jgi:lysophospholipase L1-like esterase
MIAGGVASLFAAVLVFKVLVPLNRLPANAPGRYRGSVAAGPDSIVVACLGDSITHGTVSANYVEMLSDQLPDQAYTVVNAGVNSQLARHLAARLDEIVACRPAFATVLIGTNDVNATLSASNHRLYSHLDGVPDEPDPEGYREQLRRIVGRLQQDTDARIALLSLPPIGENPEHPGWTLTDRYSSIIREVTEETGVAYLPLRERMLKLIRAGGNGTRLDASGRRVSDPGAGGAPVMRALVLRRLAGWSYNRISRRHGLTVLTDNLHLNEDGAAVVAGLIREFVLESR